LRRQGHQAILVDSFLGTDTLPQDAFASLPPLPDSKVQEDAPDLDAVRAARGDSGMGSIGKNVLEICRQADMVYMGLHGEDGENGKMQALFDVLGIPYTGTGYLGSALAMNKWISKEMFWQQNVLTPPGCVLMKGETPGEDVPLPCVVKPCSGGSSIGVVYASTREELTAALTEAFRYDDRVLVEGFITGREFSVGLLGDQVLPPIEIIPKGGFYDYAHKYQAGYTEEVCPAHITQEEEALLKEATRRACAALDVEVYGRADFILTPEGDAYCLEVNTLPGMTPTSLLPQEAAAHGLSYDQLVDAIIRLSLQKYE